MFEKIEKTSYPPQAKPVIVWDGNCGFCKYWTTRWQKITKGKLDFTPYQEAKDYFKDIDIKHFKQASRFIDTDGKIYSGPNSAYKSLSNSGLWGFLHNWYENYSLFTNLSDGLYNLIAQNRGLFFKLTKLLFGANPKEVRPFWIIYLAIIMYFMYV